MDNGLTRIRRGRKRPVDSTFHMFGPDQPLFPPQVLEDRLPAEHLARFLAELVDKYLDLGPICAAYTERRAAPPYDPRPMVRILLYGYTVGVCSSRVIERKCVDDVPFRWLSAGTAPDYGSIVRFRRRHLFALGHLFVQAFALCQAAGVVRLGRVPLDGTNVPANLVPEDVTAGLLAEAERIDKAEDATSCKNSCSGELPKLLPHRQLRLAEI